MNYEKRLLNFLKDNPKVKLTTKQIAGSWKRNRTYIEVAALNLIDAGKIKATPCGLMLREGIGGA